MRVLADICEFIVDCEHKTAPVQGEGYPSIRTPNIGPGYLILDGVNRVSQATYDAWTRRAEPQGGDLILAREAPVGNVAVVPEGLKCCLGQRTVLIRPKPSDVDSDYLCYLLLTPAVQADLLGKSGGATVHHLNLKDIRALPISELPGLSQQRKLAGHIKAYDDLIENNRRRIALLEESVRLLYREWFVDLRFPGHESLVVTNGIPDGWALCALSSVVEINPETPFEKDKLSPFVPMQALSETSMVMSAPEARAISGGAKFQNGDTLLARITPCLENGKTGFVQFLADETPVASGSTEFIVLRSMRVNPYWVYCLAREESFRRHAIASMAGADGRQRVNTKCFDAYVVLQPPASVLSDFASRVEPCFSQIQHLSDMNDRLQEARNALLPKLMSGEIAV